MAARITPDYQFRLTIDSPDAGVLQGAFWQEYENEGIAVQKLPGSQQFQEEVSGSPLLNNIEYVPGEGWQLLPLQRSTSALYETPVADGSVCGIANGRLTVATGANGYFYEYPLQRANTDLPGVSLGSVQRATGDLVITKAVPAAGGSFDVELTGDSDPSGGIPYPQGLSTITVPVDRVAKTTFNHNPSQNIFIRVKFGGVAGQNQQITFRIYFVAIPNCYVAANNQTFTGAGYYCLELAWDGTATLYEYGSFSGSSTTYVWQYLQWYNFSSADLVASYNFIQISQDVVTDQHGRFFSSQITFRHSTPYSFGNQKIGVSRDVTSQKVATYRIDQSAATGYLGPQSYPIRFDLRRDFKGWFQISTGYYPTSGSFSGSPWTVPLAAPTNNHLTVEYTGALNPGNSISVKLVDSSGAQFLPAATTTNQIGGSATFVLNKRHTYYPIFTLNTSDQTSTPRINRTRMVIDGIYGLYSATPTQTDPYTSPLGTFSWNTPGFDAAQQSGDALITDLSGNFPQLKFRGKMPARIDLYSKKTGNLLSVIGHGYVLQSKFVQQGTRKNQGVTQQGPPEVFPAPNWGNYLIRFAGPFMRLSEQQTNQTYNFAVDPTTDPVNGQPVGYKFTDIIRTLISNAGYPSTQVDVPDQPLRLVADQKQPTKIEAYTQLADILQSVGRDAFQAFLVFDSNATNGGGANDLYGCWRLRFPQVPLTEGPPQTYNSLAHFHTTPQSVRGQILGLSPGANPTTTAPNGQIVQHKWIRKFTYAPYPVPPEGNTLTVTGVGIGVSDVAAPNGTTLERPYAFGAPALFNFESAFFFEGQPITPNPDSPDFIGRAIPLFRPNPGLTSAQAVTFASRRIYDLTMQGRTYVVFSAPLFLVTDILDPLQIRPRPLMAGDAVLLDGVQYFVSQVQIEVTGTGDSYKAMANYELFSSVQLSNYQPIGDDSY